MNRGFTLIELLIAIALTAIIVLFLYKALDDQQIINKSITKKAFEAKQRDLLYTLIFRDISESNESKIVDLYNKSYKILYLTTTNSLHDIPLAYVAYYVNSKKRTLVRLESAYPFSLPVKFERVKYIFADKLIENVKKFLVYTPISPSKKPSLPGAAIQKEVKKRKSLLVYLKVPHFHMVLETPILGY